MGLFGPKLTKEQKEALRTVANTMNGLADQQKDSFERTSAQLQEFGANCVAGQRAGIGKPMHASADNEIEHICQLLRAHEVLLHSAIEGIREITIEEWAPAKFGKTQGDWVSFWETQSKFIGMALDGLASPEPLVDQPSLAKLNMFVSGFSTAGTMARGYKHIKT